MLPNTVTATLPDATTFVLTKRSEQSGTSKYSGSYATSGANREVILEVRHTRPADPAQKASSLLKMTIHLYNTDGTFDRTVRSWTVVEGELYSVGVAQAIVGANMSLLDVTAFSDEWYGGSF